MPNRFFKGPERRTYSRVVYQAGRRPELRFKDHRFQVTDISERGLGFVNDANLRLGKEMRATVIFADGSSFSFEGAVVRRKEREVGIYFRELMPLETVLKEQRATLKLP